MLGFLMNCSFQVHSDALRVDVVLSSNSKRRWENSLFIKNITVQSAAEEVLNLGIKGQKNYKMGVPYKAEGGS